MKNFVQDGDVVALIAPYTVTSGSGALVGFIFGVATNDTTSAAEGSFVVRGVLDVAKDTSTFSQGDKVYWDNSAKLCTSTTTSNKYIGQATQAQLTGDGTVRVRLHGIPT